MFLYQFILFTWHHTHAMAILWFRLAVKRHSTIEDGWLRGYWYLTTFVFCVTVSPNISRSHRNDADKKFKCSIPPECLHASLTAILSSFCRRQQWEPLPKPLALLQFPPIVSLPWLLHPPPHLLGSPNAGLVSLLSIRQPTIQSINQPTNRSIC